MKSNGDEFSLLFFKSEAPAFSNSTNDAAEDSSRNLMSEVLSTIEKKQFRIAQQTSVHLTRKQAHELYSISCENMSKSSFCDFLSFICSGVINVFLLLRENAVEELQRIIGVNSNEEILERQQPLDAEVNIRSMFSSDFHRIAVHGSHSIFTAKYERSHFFPSRPSIERTICIVNPDIINDGMLPSVISLIEYDGLYVVQQVKRTLTEDDINFLGDPWNTTYKAQVREFFQTGPSCILELIGFNAIKKLELLVGPSDVSYASMFYPKTIRGMYARDFIHNAVHYCGDKEHGGDQFESWFTKPLKAEETIAIIKPHLTSNCLKEIKHIIKAYGFEILKEKTTRLTKIEASQFYSEQRGLASFDELVSFMTSETITVLVLSRVSSVSLWRKIIGPKCALIARKRSPLSIRAKYGKNATENAVHGSDSKDSADREIKFFFHKSAVFPSQFFSIEDYLNKKCNNEVLQNAISSGLTELYKVKSLSKLNPCEWLGNWLLHNNPLNPVLKVNVPISESDCKEIDEKKAMSNFESILHASTLCDIQVVAVIGPPKSGKTSIALMIEKKFSYLYINVGDLVPMGFSTQEAVDSLYKFIKRCTCSKLVLDNFPPILEFYLAFEKRVTMFNFVIQLDVDAETLALRLKCANEDEEYTSYCSYKTNSSDFFPFFEKASRLAVIDCQCNLENVFQEVANLFKPHIILLEDTDCSISDDLWRKVCEKYNYHFLSYTLLLQNAIQAEIGETKREMLSMYLRTGQGLPDDLAVSLIHNEIKASLNRKFLLVGLPLSLNTAIALEHAISVPEFLIYCSSKNYYCFSKEGILKLKNQSVLLRYYDLQILKHISIPTINNFEIICHLLGPYLSPKLGVFLQGDSSRNEVNGVPYKDFFRSKGYTLISCKDLLRSEVARQSEYGLSIQKYVATAQPIPSDLVTHLIKRTIYVAPPTRNLIVEDFPQTMDQLRLFESSIRIPSFVLAEKGILTSNDDLELSNLLHNMSERNLLSYYDYSSLQENPSEISNILSPTQVVFIAGEFLLATAEGYRQIFQKIGYGVVFFTDFLNSYNFNEKQQTPEIIHAFAEFIRKHHSIKCIIFGFPRTVVEARHFEEELCQSRSFIYLKKIEAKIPTQFDIEDEYSSSEDEEPICENNEQSVVSMLEDVSIEMKELVDLYFQSKRFKLIIYDSPDTAIKSVKEYLQPKITLAVGHDSSNYRDLLYKTVAQMAGEYRVIQLEELLKQQLKFSPNSIESVSVIQAIKNNRSIDVKTIVEILRSSICGSSSYRFIVDGFPQEKGGGYPYVHDQLLSFFESIGCINEVIEFSFHSELIRNGIFDENTDVFYSEKAPVLNYCRKNGFKVSTVHMNQDTVFAQKELMQLLKKEVQ